MTDRRTAVGMATAAAGIPLLSPLPARASVKNGSTMHSGRDQPFNDAWQFHRGAAEGLQAPAFDDSGWRTVNLPHDWSIEDLPGEQPPSQAGPFTQASEGGTATGFTAGGEGWYRKHFRVGGLPAGGRVEIVFDGIYLESDVWLNGHYLGENLNGYNPFAYDLTPYLRLDADNVLAVRVRNLGRNSRWYCGSGIYREVRLDVLPGPSRIARWGIGAWTRSLTRDRADVVVTTQIENAMTGSELVTRLRGADGSIAAEVRSPSADTVEQVLEVNAPHLWSPDSPALYALETELHHQGKLADRVVQSFGIRIVAFDPGQGMTINGLPVKLRGGCIHHDNGLLGACAYRDADERRIRLLKARGFNAVRSAHNTASRSFRESCDRLGMMLIEEAFDAWHEGKEPQDYAVHFRTAWEKPLRAMVLAARNSPSVIMWSIGNEIPDRASDEGVAWQWKLANTVRKLDQTRPVTAGLNGVLGAKMIADSGTARPGRAGKADNASTIFLDVPGYNYRLENIVPEHGPHPERVVYASETFAREAYDYWELAQKAPYFLGEFVWTAMDYIGEAGLGANAHIPKDGPPYYQAGWPWTGAWCGDIDLIGHQKAPSLARDVIWGLSPLEMAVQRPVPDGSREWVANWGWSDELQSWTWPGAEGKPLSVRVYCSGDRIDLMLNGAKVATRTLTAKDKMRAEFTVPYAAGTLEAVAYSGGRETGRRQLETAGPAAALRIVPEPAGTRSGGQQLQFAVIEVIDAEGRLVPDDERDIHLAIGGPAGLAAFGSANPRATGSYQQPRTRSFRGRALAIVHRQGEAGKIRIEATADGVRGAAAVIEPG